MTTKAQKNRETEVQSSKGLKCKVAYYCLKADCNKLKVHVSPRATIKKNKIQKQVELPKILMPNKAKKKKIGTENR